jgi:hypothetical protein
MVADIEPIKKKAPLAGGASLPRKGGAAQLLPPGGKNQGSKKALVVAKKGEAHGNEQELWVSKESDQLQQELSKIGNNSQALVPIDQ